jgi:hypothetical protein
MLKAKATLFLIFMLSCVGQVPAAPSFLTTSKQDRASRESAAGGYALLRELAEKESNVDKILIIKNPSERVAKVLKDITDTFSDLKSEWPNGLPDPSTLPSLNKVLPDTERRARASIESETTKLVLTSSGADFEYHILMSQVKALGYADHLTRALLRQEKSPRALALLKKYQDKFRKLNNRTSDLLRDRASNRSNK